MIDTRTESMPEKPLAIRLNLRDGQTCWFDGMPEHLIDEIDEYALELRFVANPSDVKLGGLDAAHIFITELASLADGMADLRTVLAKDGQIWVSWPTESTTLTAPKVQQFGAENGYLDTKGIELDQDWSAIKFVIPKTQR